MNEELKMDFENLGAIQAEIDYLEDNVPSKGEEYSVWLERFHYLSNLYNQLSDEKIYAKIK